MKPTKSSKATSTQDTITVNIPKNKAAGGAAGAVVGGIMAGPVGALVGGALGAYVPGNTAKVKKAVSTGVTAARNSKLGQLVKRTATNAGNRISKVFQKVKAKVTAKTKSAAATAKKTVAKKAPAPKKAAKR
jgi:DNA-binding protein HU-beta